MRYIMGIRPALVLLFALVLTVATSVRSVAAAPAAPTLEPTHAYSTFHPMEGIHFKWSAVPSAVSYVLQYSKDPSFPIITRGQADNIPDTFYGFAIADEGNYWARVYAVDANGVASEPSNLITFSVFFNNPLPSPPTPLSPANGATLTLPITLKWTDSPNPQPSGYDLEIARDSSFTNIEELVPQLNDPTRTVLSLTPGKKFWRVHSVQGNASPTTAAVTAWSATGSFIVSSTPPKPVSVTLVRDPLYSGDSTFVEVQLTTTVPANGAAIAMNSSNQNAAPMPSTIQMPGNIAWTHFEMQAGQVDVPTPVTVTATINSVSAAIQFTVLPSSLKSFSMTPGSISGGAQVLGSVMLNGQAPPSGAVVNLSSNSQAVSPPASVIVAPGEFSVSFPVQTNAVATNTIATVTANWNGVSTQSQVKLTPQQTPASLTLNPTSTVGTSGGSFATVRMTAPASTDQILQITTSHPSIVRIDNGVFIPAGSTTGGFSISTTPVATQTLVTISVSGGGVTKSATLTVTPDSPPPPPVPGAPSLLSPGNNSNPAQPIALDWSDAANAVSYILQIDDSSNFTTPLVMEQSVAASQFTTSGLAAVRHWWRVRGVNSAGVVGAWSAVQNFTPRTAPAAATLSSVTASPSSVVGGNTTTGAVTLTAPAPSGGVPVSLSSSNTTAALVPASVTIPAGATSATFTITSKAVTASTPVTISASFGGITRTATLTVTQPVAADTVAIQAAEYKSANRELRIQATSSNSGAVLKCYVAATDTLIGTLQNNGGGKYSGQFTLSTNPQNIIVRSSAGGTASKAVALK